jgi:acetyl-CoA carboxylase carboxyltransferase component
MGDRAVDGDGVLGGTGKVDGRPVACFAQDASFAGGSLGEAHADTVVRVLEIAGRAKMPVVGFVESAGARMQEGVAALSGYGRIFRAHTQLSGVVPQISVVCGASAGGGSYAPALTDFVVMNKNASMFLTGPGVVRAVTGEDVDAETLGGPRVHERNGVCHAVAETEVDATLLVRDLLDHLPQHSGENALRWPPVAPLEGSPGTVVPSNDRKVYDVRHVAARLVDGGRMIEVGERWAKNIVTGVARLEGRAVGIVANQPRYIGGVLDSEAAAKGARFVRTCDLFGLPLIVLVDTPGFLPGVEQERSGVIRHGAKLVHAFAGASVPRLTVVLRKAYGGAFIAMNSKDIGADLVLAWPQAKLGVMGAEQAVGITARREIEAAEDSMLVRATLAQAYARDHLSVTSAAAGGFVDQVIAPSDTRARLASTLDALAGGNPTPRPGRNIPL